MPFHIDLGFFFIGTLTWVDKVEYLNIYTIIMTTYVVNHN